MTSSRGPLVAGLVTALLLAACGGTQAPVADAPTEPASPSASTPPLAATSATSAAEAAFPVTIEHRFGSAEIPEQPERVVSVGFTDHDYLLALGVTPVGVRDWFGDKPFATWPWAADELGDAEPAVLPMAELDYEQIAALGPDLIIGVYSGMTEEEHGLLSAIAPTLAAPEQYPDFAVPWQEQTRITGRALGLEQRAEELVAEVEAQVAAVSDAHPEFQGATAVLAAAPAPGEYYVYGDDTASSAFLISLGFEIPDEVARLADNDSSYFTFSAERLDLVDADLLVWFEAAADPGPAELLANPLYQGLAVVEEGRNLYLGYDLYAGALSFSSILSLPFVLDELVPQLAIAVDGDPATEAALGS